MTGLDWGHRLLLCPPDHFAVAYEINPWMHSEVRVDPDRARAQWEALRATLSLAGAHLDVLDPVPGVPDLVFTANAGVVDRGRFVPARFRNIERRAETPIDVAWFASAGFDVVELDDGLVHEGAGDALPFGGPARAPVLLSGYRTRSDARSHAALGALLGVPVRSVELVDPRLYHLDLTFCPLDDRSALVAPDAWDRYGCTIVDALVPDPVELSLDDALAFVANSVVVGDLVVMPACPPRVGRSLEQRGFTVEVVDVGEFRKAGGACRCLTLALDVDLGPGEDP